jgi:hypothetical protein
LLRLPCAILSCIMVHFDVGGMGDGWLLKIDIFNIINGLCFWHAICYICAVAGDG